MDASELTSSSSSSSNGGSDNEEEINEEEYKEEDRRSSLELTSDNLSKNSHAVLSTIAAASVEQAQRLNANFEIATLYKGRKYNWNAKVNLHVHIIDHPYANTIEIIGYNTNTFTEAEHLYVSSSYIYQKSDDPDVEEKVDMVFLEYQKAKAKIVPSIEAVKLSMQQQRVATYILDRLHVVTKPKFVIDVRESDKGYRMSSNMKQSSTDRRPSTHESDLSFGDSNVSSPITLSIRKPDTVIPSLVKRVGKSTTVIGDIVSVKQLKEDEQLQKIISTLNSSSFNNQAKRILNRVSLLQRNSTMTSSQLNNSSQQQEHSISKLKRRGGIFHASNVQNTANLKFFAKFKNDNDLLQESLSFLHVSDMLEMMCVCKRWQQVLAYAIRTLNPMVITSKDYYQYCNLDRDYIFSRIDYVESHNRKLMQMAMSLISRSKTSTRPALQSPNQEKQSFGESHIENQEARNSNEFKRRSFDSTEENFVEDYHHHLAQSNRLGLSSNFDNHNHLLVMPDKKEWPMLRVPRQFLLRQKFCMPETVQYFIRNASRSITELRLHYVILNRDSIASLSSLTGRLKSLILGTIKIDDTSKDAVLQESVGSHRALTETTAPGVRPPLQSTPSNHNRKPGFGRKVVAATEFVHTSTNSPNKAPVSEALRSIPTKQKGVKKLRFMDSNDLQEILFACGSGLTHLEVSLTVGDITANILKLMPKLTHFVAQNTLFAPKITSMHTDIEGNVLLDEIANALVGIPMPDLLTLMSDSVTEAFCLTDRRGKVVTVNAPWEKVFGHSRVDIVGSSLDFLCGPLTDQDEFEEILQGLKNQLRAEEITTFVYTKDEQPILAQLILLPNLSKWKGLPLNFDCLEPDLIGEMALEHEEILKQKSEESHKKSQQKSKFEKGKKDWRSTNRELSYHLLRFGVLSTSFVPYQNAYNKMR